jgi:hypothetical protein
MHMKKILALALLLIGLTACTTPSEQLSGTPSPSPEKASIPEVLEPEQPEEPDDFGYVDGIVNTYKQSVPVTRFIGKSSPTARDWDEWWANDWFGDIQNAAGGEEKVHWLYEDGDAYIDMYLYDEDERMREHWIGMFTPSGTEAPEGFEYIDFPESNLGVCWVYGTQGSVFRQQWDCMDTLAEEGMEIKTEENGFFWVIQRYQYPRFIVEDEKGKVLLDYCFFVE